MRDASQQKTHTSHLISALCIFVGAWGLLSGCSLQSTSVTKASPAHVNGQILGESNIIPKFAKQRDGRWAHGLQLRHGVRLAVADEAETTTASLTTTDKQEDDRPLPKIKRRKKRRKVRRKRRKLRRKRRKRRRKGKRRARRKKKKKKKIVLVSAKRVDQILARLQPVVFKHRKLNSEKSLHKVPSKRPLIPLPKDRRFRWVVKKYRGLFWGFTWSIMKNRGQFEAQMRRHLKTLDVPEELFLLPGIESNYKVRLISSVGAVGIWQFMYKTGRRFKLNVSAWHDERRHIRKATLGGGRYLRDLYRHFGRWEFAIAAYNCGKHCVERALKRCPNMTFWKMRVSRCGLPAETREYVARFFAMLHSLKNPPRPERPIKPKPAVVLASVKTPGPMSLIEISKGTGIPLRKLHFYNPELSSWATPPKMKYELLVSPKDVPKVKSFLSKKRPGAYWIKEVPVQPGEDIQKIARRHGLTEKEVRVYNRIWRGPVPSRRRYLLLPMPWGKQKWRRSRKVNRYLAKLTDKIRRFRWRYPVGYKIHRRGFCHRARRGQSLFGIARRYGMSRYRIKLYNPGVTKVRSGDLIRLRYNAKCGKRKRPRLASAFSS